jgi:AcrR family transcriptional regulator
MNGKREATKEKILLVAKSLFGRFGPKKTTVDEIAAGAGVGKGTIYYHFKAKDEIFLEVIQREADELSLRLRKAISSCTTPQGQLQAFFTARLASVREFLNLSWLNQGFEMITRPRIEKQRDQLAREETKLMEEILHQGLDQGVFAVNDIKATALHLLTFLRGIEFSLPESLSLKDIEARVENLLQVVLQGLEARAQEESIEG